MHNCFRQAVNYYTASKKGLGMGASEAARTQYLRKHSFTLSRPRESYHTQTPSHTARRATATLVPALRDETQTIKKQTKPNQETHLKQAIENYYPRVTKRTDEELGFWSTTAFRLWNDGSNYGIRLKEEICLLGRQLWNGEQILVLKGLVGQCCCLEMLLLSWLNLNINSLWPQLPLPNGCWERLSSWRMRQDTTQSGKNSHENLNLLEKTTTRKNINSYHIFLICLHISLLFS